MNALNKITNSINAYQLFAITVLGMILGHTAYYFFPEILALRIPDRILAPVFLISVGFNSGHKLGKLVIIGAIVVTGLNYLVIGTYYIGILGTIIAVRYLIEPLANTMLKSKESFWVITLGLILLYPVTNSFIEYGTLAVILGLAGWLVKNESEVDAKIVTPHNFMLIAYIAYVVGVQFAFNFPPLQLAAIAVGTAFIMYLLYNMRRLLLNSIRDKSQSIIKKTYKFVGKKSLEIYMIHIVAFQIIYFLMIAHGE